MAVTKQDSIFANISLPGGISTKATEFKELAVKGDKWESPVFSIGSAPESTDIPKLPTVTRKSRNHPTSGRESDQASDNKAHTSAHPTTNGVQVTGNTSS